MGSWGVLGRSGVRMAYFSESSAQAWNIRAVVTNRFITLNLQGGGCSLLGRDTILLGELKCVRLDEDGKGFGVDDSNKKVEGFRVYSLGCWI